MNKIKQYRNAAGATQKELGELLGVGQSTIDRYESGVRMVNYQIAWKIVDSLNQLGAKCSFDDVFPNPNPQHNTNAKQ